MVSETSLCPSRCDVDSLYHVLAFGVAI
jgi:hypothetical protein